ncbi:hypothetical protein M406DRAFT_332041 [Cryphonectria parasitica EP155]|uniref:Uncharacterized protein n=1 Tax=Cryphonectria parasitica (strain ATCC 38755 / EP155) TaxID=660469 RepID=A0A9P4XYD2_CRYP1|nr:uncharacterized protein M406DRAFT_332041 [Cryphonectria parasitica EP155]KAF3763569.1 hypothetical protein M406DRAFT_332041 [Cryphonectria parasitica EP155]
MATVSQTLAQFRFPPTRQFISYSGPPKAKCKKRTVPLQHINDIFPSDVEPGAADASVEKRSPTIEKLLSVNVGGTTNPITIESDTSEPETDVSLHLHDDQDEDDDEDFPSISKLLRRNASLRGNDPADQPQCRNDVPRHSPPPSNDGNVDTANTAMTQAESNNADNGSQGDFRTGEQRGDNDSGKEFDMSEHCGPDNDDADSSASGTPGDAVGAASCNGITQSALSLGALQKSRKHGRESPEHQLVRNYDEDDNTEDENQSHSSEVIRANTSSLSTCSSASEVGVISGTRRTDDDTSIPTSNTVRFKLIRFPARTTKMQLVVTGKNCVACEKPQHLTWTPNERFGSGPIDIQRVFIMPLHTLKPERRNSMVRMHSQGHLQHALHMSRSSRSPGHQVPMWYDKELASAIDEEVGHTLKPTSIVIKRLSARDWLLTGLVLGQDDDEDVQTGEGQSTAQATQPAERTPRSALRPRRGKQSSSVLLRGDRHQSGGRDEDGDSSSDASNTSGASRNRQEYSQELFEQDNSEEESDDLDGSSGWKSSHIKGFGLGHIRG